jgi:teichuronic acid exporter
MAVVLAVRLVVLAVVARYLSRTELGLVSMLLAIVTMMQAFGDFGLSGAIVQRSDVKREQMSSMFWLAQGFGIGTFVLVWAFDPAIVRLYGEPRLHGLVGWLALRFVLTPVGIPFQAILQRDLEFRRTFAIQTVAALCGGAVTIVAALRGAGVYAMIGGELVTAAVQSLLALALGWHAWRPQVRFRRHDLRGTMSFGLYQIGERALNLVATNVDYVFVGRVLGAETLGAYAVAFELMSMPARLNNVVTRVAFPVLARRQDDDAAFRRGLMELVRLVALVHLPILAVFAILAPLIVPVFLGPSWSEAVPLVQILALFGAIRVLGNPSGPAFLAKGRPSIGFYFNLVVAIVATAAFSIVVSHGVETVAWTWAVLGAIQLFALVVIIDVITGLHASDWVATLWRALLLTAIAVGILELARWGTTYVSVPQSARLAIAIAGSAIVFLPIALGIERSFLSSLIRHLRQPPAG